jgi:protocatechuate 3,4-dioxygenase alpha subunit
VGPFFGFALPDPKGHQVVDPATPGAVRIEGQVLDGDGAPVPDAMIEIWQADPSGRYRTTPPGAPGSVLGSSFTGFGRCGTDAEGLFRFVTVKPGPTIGAEGRTQAPHLNVTVFARGLLRHLVTRMYFPDEEEANAADPVLNLVADQPARSTLVARQEGGVLRFDIHLQGDRETVFFAL